MKNVLRWLLFAVISYLLIPPQFAAAQSFGIGFGMPTAQIIIVNGTDDGYVVPTIGDRTGAALVKGGRWSQQFGAYGSGGQMAIFAQVCSAAQTEYRLDSAPAWTRAIDPSLALTDDYLESKPSEPTLKIRVEQIKKLTQDQLGGKMMRKELDFWFKMVKKRGVSVKGTNCESPITVPALTFQWNGWLTYGYNTVTIVTVVGNRGSRYHLVAPWYVQ